MPLLAPETCLFPENLFEKSNEGALERWWVLHTRPRTEKALARMMAARSVPFFLPQHKQEWLSNGRRQSSHLPLFPGYCFVWADEEGRSLAVESNYVANCLPVKDQERLHSELQDIHRLIAGNVPLSSEKQVAAGSPIEIIDGPFKGLTGKLIRIGSNARFVVEVRMINQGVSIDIHRWMFRTIAPGGDPSALKNANEGLKAGLGA